MVAEMKQEREPAEPSAEQEKETADTTAPTVMEVGWYSDWKLTQPIEGEVTPETTIYTKVVFSEPMQYIASDKGNARPVLFYLVGDKETRYRIKPRGASGENFQSGDSKPLHDGTDDFICKYTIQADDIGMFTIKIGKASADANGNMLTEHYVHSQALEIQSLELPEEPEQSTELFFMFGDGTNNKPFSPKEEERENQRDFVGCVFIAKANPEGRARLYSQPISGVTVTIVSGTRSSESVVTDQNGRYAFPNVEEDELHLLVEREHCEPKEVVVHRSFPTSLPGGIVPNYRGDPQRIPGNILIGQLWPEDIRFILERTLVVHDLLYIEASLQNFIGFYESGVIAINSDVIVSSFDTSLDVVNVFLGRVAHEIGHAHQHAVVSIDGSGNVHDWVNTPEGRAFKEARKKDWEEHGKSRYDIKYDPSAIESAAEICSYHWSTNRWRSRVLFNDLKTSAPNRLKWAEEWLNK